MERDTAHKEYIPRDIVYTPEQIAIQALVDRLITKSDAGAFSEFNKYFNEDETS